MKGAITIRTAALGMLLAAAVNAGLAQDTVVRSTPIAATAQAAQPTDRNGLTQTEVLQAQLWGLTPEEMQRATILLKGPRASFSVANLSPVEALGIHARTPGERRKYAEHFVRALRQDVDRVLEWSQAGDEAKRRLYPNEPVISFDNLPKADVDPAIAAGANVPRSALLPRRATPAAAPIDAKEKR